MNPTALGWRSDLTFYIIYTLRDVQTRFFILILIFSECDSGVGSASDSGRRSKDQSDASEKSSNEKSDSENEKDVRPSVTLEQIKANFGRKPVKISENHIRISYLHVTSNFISRNVQNQLCHDFRPFFHQMDASWRMFWSKNSGWMTDSVVSLKIFRSFVNLHAVGIQILNDSILILVVHFLSYNIKYDHLNFRKWTLLTL